MRKIYPSDIAREQFNIILPILESVKKTIKHRTIDLYDVFCGLLYLLKSGCQWRMIPHDFSKWRRIYAYFQIWNKLQRKDPRILDLAFRINKESFDF